MISVAVLKYNFSKMCPKFSKTVITASNFLGLRPKNVAKMQNVSKNVRLSNSSRKTGVALLEPDEGVGFVMFSGVMKEIMVVESEVFER